MRFGLQIFGVVYLGKHHSPDRLKSFWLHVAKYSNLKRCVNSTGAYDEEESAARAYDLAALKYWGATTFTNFPV